MKFAWAASWDSEILPKGRKSQGRAAARPYRILKKQITIFVNGILTWPGDTRDWNYRAVVWTQLRVEGMRTMAVEYFCGPIGRAFGQRKRAAKITELLNAYAGYEITLVGHSNGCAVILAALSASLVYPNIAAIHFVSGACEADFERNGLNEALEDGRVGKVYIYVGGKDRALKLASRLIGRALGYGVLGLHGPKNVTVAAMEKVGVLKWPSYGHSDCWKPEHFDRTMRHFFT